MAIIEQQVSIEGSLTGWDITDVCPAGTYVGVCLEVKDTFDVTRPKYEDPSQTEVVNLTRFLFGVQGADGIFYKIQTHDLKISGHEKSALMGLLTAWKAKPVDQLVGWDYCEMAGEPAMITVIQKTSQKGRVYATAQNVVAPPPQMADQAPDPSKFALPPADSQIAQGAQTPAAVPTPQVINETPKSHFGGEVVVQPKVPIKADVPQTETSAENAKTEGGDEPPPF